MVSIIQSLGYIFALPQWPLRHYHGDTNLQKRAHAVQIKLVIQKIQQINDTYKNTDNKENLINNLMKINRTFFKH